MYWLLMTGSPDGTADKVDELQIFYPEKLFLIKEDGKLGLGTAYIEVLNGPLQTDMNLYLKWTLIFRITRKIWNGSIVRVSMITTM
jgi:hypothetical protein